MNTEPPESSLERWWWRAWYVFAVGALIWIAWCGWLARPVAPWTKGWVGWWTADQMASRPLWHFNAQAGEGADVVSIDGNPVFQTSGGSVASLGRWREDDDRWTWAGWVKVTTPTGAWPTNVLVVRSAQSPSFRLSIGFDHGRPVAIMDAQYVKSSGMPWAKIVLASPGLVPLGQWVHVALSADYGLQYLTVNGVQVAWQRSAPGRLIGLAALKLEAEGYAPDENPETIRSLRPHCVVEQDDLVAFDRVVKPEEFAGLVAQGRGGWVREVERPARAAQLWRHGLPVALLTLLGLLAFKLLPRFSRRLVLVARNFFQPSYRSVRWTLVGGILITTLFVGILAVQGRRMDEQRFADILSQFKRDTDDEWERLAGLLLRAKDWVASQTNLSQASWETWLQANRFPHSYPGTLGIGYAEQLLPEDLAAHENRWSITHGFDYRINPPLSEPRQQVIELEGNPRLPVVLYSAPDLDRRLWFTNHTILGRDLLFQAPGDQRSWAEARRVEQVAARNEVQTSSLEEIAPAGWYGRAIRGLRLYVPSTLRTKKDHSWLRLESSAWRGVMFASVDVDRLLLDRFGSRASPIGFRLHTGKSDGTRLDLVADSVNFISDSSDRSDAYLRRTLAIPFYYRRLFLDAWTTRTFEAHSMRRWPWIAAATGGAFTLLATALLVVQIRARETQGRVLRALRAANSELLLAYRDRERLSRDLHDGSIQNLYGLGLHLQRVQTVLAVSPERAREELNDSLSMLDQSIEELRQFILTSGVESLQHHTAASALEALVERLRKNTELDLQLHLDDHAATLDPRAGVQVLNIVREGVSNAFRHAGAKRVEIRLGRLRSQGNDLAVRWFVSITDDGRGFDRDRVNGHGRGLKNLAVRAIELGGRSEIDSTPGKGTQIVVEFPASVQTLDESLSIDHPPAENS
jgi:signal transduction histidine kinase